MQAGSHLKKGLRALALRPYPRVVSTRRVGQGTEGVARRTADESGRYPEGSGSMA